MRFISSLTLGFSLLAALAPSAGHACSCAETVSLEWPKPGATSVSTRPDIVFARAAYLKATSLLRAPDGREVALVAQGLGVVETSQPCADELAFFVPATELAPNTRYEVVSRGVDNGNPQAWSPPYPSFTTGASVVSTSAPADPPIALRAYALHPVPECANVALLNRPACASYLQFKVPSTRAAEPVWLRLRTSASGKTFQLPTANAFEAMLVVDAHDTCLMFDRIDVQGRVVEQGKQCAPERCARVSLDVIMHWQNCAGPFALPESAWAMVQANRCAEPLPTFTATFVGLVGDYALTRGAGAPPSADAGAQPAAWGNDASSAGALSDAGAVDAAPALAPSLGQPASQSGTQSGSGHADSASAASANQAGTVDEQSSGGCALGVGRRCVDAAFAWLLLLALGARRTRGFRQRR